MRRSTVLLAAVLVALLVAMAAKAWQIQPPPLRTQASADQFNAVRAKARLSLLLREERPHPTDTAANDVVRARLVSLLAGMGLRTVVRDQMACNQLYKTRGVGCARVRNVVAMIGPPRGKALLLASHYDSTPVGPGAGDDGIGVATLLEIASILKDRPLERPVILLFDEGEELGLIGARAFLADPLSQNVDSLVNLEARGVRGPVNMFETSRPNGAAIEVFSRASASPVANSLSTDVYRLMPNYTDVNSFAERRWLTLNLAPIGNETRYHSPGDDLAALDPATLQHMGDQTLALAVELAKGRPTTGGERIFMDLGGRMLLTLPLGVGMVLLAGLLFAFALVSVRRGGLARSAAIILGALLLSTALAWGAVALVGALRPGMYWRAHPMWTHLAAYASVITVGVALLATLGRGVQRRQLRPLFWLIFGLLGAIVALAAPGGVVYFLLPPMLALAGIVLRRWWTPAESVAALAALAALYLTWGAMLGLLEELLNTGPMWLFAPLGAVIVLPALIEAKPLIDAAGLRAASAIGGLLTLLGWGLAAAAPAYSADRQQRFGIEHVTDARNGKASWSVLSGRAPLPKGFGGGAKWRWDELPQSKQKRWVAEAPPAPGIQAPTAEKVEELRGGRERLITVRLRPNGAQRVTLVGPKDAQIRSAGVAGFVRPIDPAAQSGEYLITCFGRSCDGLDLQISTGQPKPIAFKLVGTRPGLPASARPLVQARPRCARPQYSPDQTIVVARITL